MQPVIDQIGALEPQAQALSDADLRAKTDEFKRRIRERLVQEFGEETVAKLDYRHMRRNNPAPDLAGSDDSAEADINASTAFADRVKEVLQDALNEILPEAFAVVREAGRRVLNMRHFDVQLIGGMVLHQGKISEMKTGEGKTLVATLPVYLNALAGFGVHVVTVNDYLAKRDSEWMGKLYNFLG